VKTARATSAGGIVVNDRGDVLMIARRSPAGKQQWTLPKGLVESGESAEETAVREVAEETGVVAEITGEARTIDYWFVWKPDDVRYHKFVHYFPMRALSNEAGPRDSEAEEVAWFPPHDAVARASFGNEKAVLGDVLGFTAQKTGSARTQPAGEHRSHEPERDSKSPRRSSSR
jgi:8-oxo-dGTP pyrophosphatase MutT (NUDIX family)